MSNREDLSSRTNACTVRRRNWVLLPVLLVNVLATGCAELGLRWPIEPATPASAAVQPVATPPIDVQKRADLPALDVVVIAFHSQCESPSTAAASASDAQQLRELMVWLKRNCVLNETNTASQLMALKRLRNAWRWPESYAAWLDEWRRDLLRLQQWQQRALAAESEQKQIVKKLKAIENDLITRP